MKHYIVLLEEKRILPGTYASYSFVKTGETENELPEPDLILASVEKRVMIGDIIKQLEQRKWTRYGLEVTISEFLIHPFAALSAFFFDTESCFRNLVRYDRKY